LRPAPLGGLFRFWALSLQRLSANHFALSGIPHRGRSAVKRAVEPPTIQAAQVPHDEAARDHQADLGPLSRL